MLTHKAAARYARALFEKAVQAGQAEAIEAELRPLAATLERTPRGLELLRSPVIAPEDKKRALRGALGPSGSALTLDFLSLLVDKKRAGLLPAITDAYHRMLNQHRGVVEVEVVSAVPLRADEEQRLVRVLERRTRARVLLHRRVDGSLLGGVTLRWDDTVVSGSVRSSLTALYRELVQAKVGPA